MNPAEHSARQDAERRGLLHGSDVDRIEAAVLADVAGEDEGGTGCWWPSGEVPA